MSTLGLIRGLTREDCGLYTRLWEQEAPALNLELWSVEFDQTWQAWRQGGWDQVGELAAQGARELTRRGAEVILLATSTAHKVHDAAAQATDRPLPHLVDVVGQEARRRGWERVGLLATRFITCEGFFHHRLKDRHGLTVRVPEPADIELVEACFHQELLAGEYRQESRDEMLRIMEVLAASGAQGVILGCTHLAELLGGAKAALPLLDAARVHARAGLEMAARVFHDGGAGK